MDARFFFLYLRGTNVFRILGFTHSVCLDPGLV